MPPFCKKHDMYYEFEKLRPKFSCPKCEPERHIVGGKNNG